MPFKIEYRTTKNGEWKIYGHAGSLTNLMNAADRLRRQGFEVRCLNSLGENILKD